MSGTQSLSSSYLGGGKTYDTTVAGLNQPVSMGENAVVYIRINECAPPREIKIIWYSSSAGYKSAYLGQNVIGGENIDLGALPTTSDWVRVEVPFSQLGFSSTNVTKVELSYADGQVWFDHIGKH